jgi:predicted AlkP superfamily phosphohydrolase/phosphomutase
MKNHEWDFLMMVFNGTDLIQHQLWHCIDSKHNRYNPKEAEKYGDAMLKYHQAVDEKVGQLIRELDSKTTVVIMSDHGNGPIYKWIYLNNWLMKLNFLKLKKDVATAIKYSMFKLGITPKNVYELLKKLGFSKAKVGHASREVLLQTFFLSFNNIDWKQTKAYALGHIGKIYINLKGREPQGIVEPGNEYESLRREIIEQLHELKDPQTGERVVEKVFLKEEVYSGECLEQAPDILFLPKDLEYQAIGVSAFDSNGIIEPSFGNTGDHRMNGLFMIMGDRIKQGLKLEGAQITDLAPTILHLMNTPVPEDMDGKVLTDLFTEDFLNSNSVEYQHSSDFDARNEIFEYDEADEREIKKRLKALGYLV